MGSLAQRVKAFEKNRFRPGTLPRQAGAGWRSWGTRPEVRGIPLKPKAGLNGAPIICYRRRRGTSVRTSVSPGWAFVPSGAVDAPRDVGSLPLGRSCGVGLASGCGLASGWGLFSSSWPCLGSWSHLLSWPCLGSRPHLRGWVWLRHGTFLRRRAFLLGLALPAAPAAPGTLVAFAGPVLVAVLGVPPERDRSGAWVRCTGTGTG